MTATHETVLAALFGAQLHEYHVATRACPLPPITKPLTWIVAANGTFVRGVSPVCAVVLQLDQHCSPIPNLVSFHAGIQWPGHPQRLPSSILQRVLMHARHMTDAQGTPIEHQYVIADRGDGPTILRPPQCATAQRVISRRANFPIMCDIHSHHCLPAYFSPTDDRDDALQLGASVVIGSIFTRPTIRVRLTVYGQVQEVPATAVFEDLGPFSDTFGATYDSTDPHSTTL